MAIDSTEREKELTNFLDAEKNDADGYEGSQIAQEQAESMRRYHWEKYGDELPNRSQTRTTDVFDTVNSTIPYLSKVFTRTSDLIKIVPNNESDEKLTEDIAQFIQHVMFVDNDMKRLTKRYAFDGLVNKIGVMSTTWEPSSKGVPIEISSATIEVVNQYSDDDEYEILAISLLIDEEPFVEEINDEEIEMLSASGMIVSYDMTVQHTPKSGRVKIELIRPSNFRIKKDANSIETASYCGTSENVYLSEIIKMYPRKKEALTEDGSGDVTIISNDDRDFARMEDSVGSVNDYDDVHTKMVVLDHDFVRYDFDGDGVVELRHVKRIGDVILENIIVEDNPYSIWAPLPEAHKIFGKSLAEVVEPIQYNRTILMRSTIDVAIAATRPRLAAIKDALTDQGLDALYENELGGIILTKRDANIQPIISPDVTGATMSALSYLDQERAARTGVTKFSQGTDPAGIAKTMGGQEMLIDAADTRKEEYAVELGYGIESIARKTLTLVCRHQNYVRTIQVGKKWIEFDPRKWSDKMTVNIGAGLSAGNRRAQTQSLEKILQIQRTIATEMGIDNPFVKPKQITETLREMIKSMGWTDASRFFEEAATDEEMALAEEEKQANTDPRSPDQIQADGKVQVEMAKIQAQGELAVEQMRSEEQRKNYTAEADASRKNQVEQSNMERKNHQLDAELAMRAHQINAELSLIEGQKLAEFKINSELKNAEFKLHEHLTNKKMDADIHVKKTHIGGEAGK